MISPHFPPEFGWYGPGRDSMELALELSQRGYEVDVIACAGKLGIGETFQDGVRVIRVNWQNNVRNNSLITHTLPRARLLFNLNLAVWQAYLQSNRKNQYDIVDTCGNSAECLIASLLSESPIIDRVYDCQPAFLQRELKLIGDSGFRLEKHLTDALQSISNQFADTEITFGSGTNSEMEDRAANCLNYSLDTITFCDQGPKAIDTQGRPALLVHTSIENQHYQELLEGIITVVKKEIPDLWLTVVAHDIYTESSEKILQEALARSGIVCDMIINHNMSRLLMPGLWRSSWCGLILDWQDLYPYAVLEPLACAVPIIVEPASGSLGFLKKPDLLIAPSQFTASLVAEKLIATLKDERHRQELGNNSRQYILANHCRKTNGDALIVAYEAALEKYQTTSRRDTKIERLERLLDQVRSLSDGVDQWLHDLLFVRSFRFRLSHWLNKILKNKASCSK